jgi:imidazoleglycerol phosphate dehydratase HisB
LTEDAKDWTLDANVNVVAQTLAEMAVDIAAQSLGSLGVDIEAQSLGNMNVDLAAQSMGNTSVDIAAQSVSELAVDIASQTLSNLTVDIAAQTISNLAVDIASQTLSALDVNISGQDLSNVNVDLNAQSIGDLTVDIAAQTISELYQRPKYGAAQKISDHFNVTAGSTTEIVNISGRGKIYGGALFMEEETELSSQTGITVIVDGETVHSIGYEELKEHRMIENGQGYVYLTRYEPFLNSAAMGFSRDITFESSFVVRVMADIRWYVDCDIELTYSVV